MLCFMEPVNKIYGCPDFQIFLYPYSDEYSEKVLKAELFGKTEEQIDIFETEIGDRKYIYYDQYYKNSTPQRAKKVCEGIFACDQKVNKLFVIHAPDLDSNDPWFVFKVE